MGVWLGVSGGDPSACQVSVARVSEDWINVADAERGAAEKLEAGPLGYFAGGAGDEVTLRDNVEAWRRWRLRPRVLTGRRRGRATAVELLGGPVSMPLLVAPVAYQRLADPDGEVGDGAAAAGGRNGDVPLDPGDGAAQRGRRRAPPAGAGSSSTASRTRR